MEWMVKTEQEDSGVKKREQEVLGVQGYQEHLEKKYKVSDKRKRREALRQELEAYNESKARIYNADGKLIVSGVALLFFTISLISQYPFHSNSLVVPAMAGCLFASLVVSCAFWVKCRRLKKAFNKDSIYKIKSQIKEISRSLEQYESELKAHQAYSNSNLTFDRLQSPHRN